MKNSVLNYSIVIIALTVAVNFAQAEASAVGQGKQLGGPVISQKDDQVVVSGTISRGVASHRVSGAHVHVQLVDSKGKILSSVSQSLPPTTPKRDAAQNYRVKYAVTFPSVQSSKAAGARVQYVSKSHQECKSSVTKSHCSSC